MASSKAKRREPPREASTGRQIAWPPLIGAAGIAGLAALTCWRCRLAAGAEATDWVTLFEPVDALLWPPGVRWFCVGWFAVLGASFGSFLNVVVYRLPLGLSLSQPSSHCPRCQHAIRWRDNVPVLGWLLLRGKCRDCAQPISPRYPLVEAAAGLICLALAWWAMIHAAPTLPPRTAWTAGPLTHLREEGELLALTVAYSGLLLTLLAAALIEHDGHRPPARLWIASSVLGALLVYWPGDKPLNLWLAGPEVVVGPPAELAGSLLASAFVALLFWRRSGSREISAAPAAGGALAVALSLGWMEGLLLATLALIAGRLSGRPHAALLIATAAWLLIWRWCAWGLEQGFAWPTVALLCTTLALAIRLFLSAATPTAASRL